MSVTEAAFIVGRGGPEVLELRECPMPHPSGKQARVRVEHAGVAYGDVVRRVGLMAPRKPFVPGYDVVGIVDAVGSEVSEDWVGKRVAVLMPRIGNGGYARHVCVPENRLVPVPEGVSPVTALALGLNYITAYQLLDRLVTVPAGAPILVHGAAGGVGTALLDIARHQGLEAHGTASARKHDVVRRYGGEPIDYRSCDFTEEIAKRVPEGVGAVFDPIGGAHLMRSRRVLRRGGTLVAFGVSGDLDRGLGGVALGMGRLIGLLLWPDGRRVLPYGITVNPSTGPLRCADDWRALLALAAAGHLDPLVGERVPFEKVRHAHELIDAGAVAGKIVLDM